MESQSRFHHSKQSNIIEDRNNCKGPQRNSALNDSEDELILPGYDRRPSITLTCPDAYGEISSDDESNDVVIKNPPPPSPTGGRKSPMLLESDSEEDFPNGMLRFNNSSTGEDLYDSNDLTEEELQEMYRIPPPPSPIPGRKSPAFNSSTDEDLYDINDLTEEELQEMYRIPPPPSPIPGRKSPAFIEAYNDGMLNEDSLSDEEMAQMYKLPPPPSPIPGRKSPAFTEDYNQDYESDDNEMSNISRNYQKFNKTVMDSSINRSQSAVEISSNIYRKNLPLISDSNVQEYKPVYAYRVDLSNVMPQPYVARYKSFSQGLNMVTHHVEAPTSKKSENSSVQDNKQYEIEPINKEPKDSNGKVKTSLKNKIAERENQANSTSNPERASPTPQPRSVYPTVGTNKVTFTVSKENKSTESDIPHNYEIVNDTLALAANDSDEDLSLDELSAISALEDAVDSSLQLYSCSNETFHNYDELEYMKQDQSITEQHEPVEEETFIHHDKFARHTKSTGGLCPTDESDDLHNSSNTLSRDSLDGYLSGDMNSLKDFIVNDDEEDWEFDYCECTSQGENDTDSEAGTTQNKQNMQEPKKIKNKKEMSMGKKIFNRNKENKNKNKGPTPKSSPYNLNEPKKNESKTSPSRFGSLNIFKSGNKDKAREEGKITNIDTTGSKIAGWSESEMEEFLMKNQEQNLKLGLLDENDIKNKNTIENISQPTKGNWSADAMEKYLMESKDTNLKLGILDQEDVSHSKSPGYTQKVAPAITVHNTQYIKKQNPISLQEVKDTTDGSEGWSKSAMEDYLMQNKDENLRLGLFDEDDVAYIEAKRDTAVAMADPRPTPHVTVHDVVVIDTEKFYHKKQDIGGTTLHELKASRMAASKIPNVKSTPTAPTHHVTSTPTAPTHYVASTPTAPTPSSKHPESWHGPATLQEQKAARMAARMQQKSPAPIPIYSSQRIPQSPKSQYSHLEVEHKIQSVSLPSTPKNHLALGPSSLHIGGKSPKSRKAPRIPNQSYNTYDPTLTPMKHAISLSSQNITLEPESPYHSDSEFEEIPQTPMRIAIEPSEFEEIPQTPMIIAIEPSEFEEFPQTPMRIAIEPEKYALKDTISPSATPAKIAKPSSLITPMHVAKKKGGWTARDMEKYILDQDIDQQKKLGFVTNEEVEIDQWKNETGLVPLCDTRWTRESLRQNHIVHASSCDSILSPSPPGSPTIRSPTDSCLSSPSHRTGGMGPGPSPKRSRTKRLKPPRSPSPAPSQKTAGHIAMRGFKLGKRVMKRALSTAGSNQNLDQSSQAEFIEQTEHEEESKPSISTLERIGIKLPGLGVPKKDGEQPSTPAKDCRPDCLANARKEGPIARIGRLLGREPESPQGERRAAPSPAPAHALFLSPTAVQSEDEEEGGVRKKIGDMRLKLNFFRRRDDVSVRPIPEEAQLWGDSFQNLMASKYGQALFKAFLQREFSEENVEFWLAVEDYKKTRSNKLASKATKIHTDYVAVRSPKEINIDSNTRETIGKNLENPDKSLFDMAQKRIQGLMEADSYLRFLQSELYKELLHPETSENKPESL